MPPFIEIGHQDALGRDLQLRDPPPDPGDRLEGPDRARPRRDRRDGRPDLGFGERGDDRAIDQVEARARVEEGRGDPIARVDRHQHVESGCDQVTRAPPFRGAGRCPFLLLRRDPERRSVQVDLERERGVPLEKERVEDGVEILGQGGDQGAHAASRDGAEAHLVEDPGMRGEREPADRRGGRGRRQVPSSLPRVPLRDDQPCRRGVDQDRDRPNPRDLPPQHRAAVVGPVQPQGRLGRDHEVIQG